MDSGSTVVNDIALEIANDLICAGEVPTDFHDIASSYVECDLMDAHLEGMTLEERLDTFEPAVFDLRDWLGGNMKWSGPSAVSQILHGMYVTSIRQALQSKEDLIEVAVDIHYAIESLAEEVYHIGDSPDYTGVVHEFFTWCSEDDEFSSLGIRDFNEMHVRGIEPVDITNDVLIDALEEWSMSPEYHG